MRAFKRILILLLPALLLAGTVSIQAASAGTNTTTSWAWASPAHPNQFMEQLKIQTHHGWENAQTTAIAGADTCTGCRAVAIAVEVNLVGFASGNLNQNTKAKTQAPSCTNCTVAAAAYQFTLASTKGVPCITKDGYAELATINTELKALKTSTDDESTIQSDVQGLMGQVLYVLVAETIVSPTDCWHAPHVHDGDDLVVSLKSSTTQPTS